MTDHDPRADLPIPKRRPSGGGHASGDVPRPVVEPVVVYEPPPPPRIHGDPAMRKDLGFVLFVVAAIVIGLVTWNAAGVLTSEAFSPEASQPVAVIDPLADPPGPDGVRVGLVAGPGARHRWSHRRPRPPSPSASPWT